MKLIIEARLEGDGIEDGEGPDTDRRDTPS